MAEFTRCPRCGLSQLLQETCKRCGRPLAAREAAAAMPRVAVRRGTSRFDAYRAIWTSPRATLRRILGTDPSRAVVLLAWLVGISDALDAAAFRSSSDLPVPVFLAYALVMGPPMGFTKVYAIGWLTSLTGRWLGGRAGREDCRAVVAWSGVPQIAGLALWVPACAIFGNEIFRRETPRLDDSIGLILALVALAALWLFVQAWSGVVLWKGLGEAHGFSAWKGFLASFLARLIALAPVLVIVVAALALGLVPGHGPKASPVP